MAGDVPAARFLEIEPGTTIPLPEDEHGPKASHVIDGDSIEAVNAALASGRPLLLEGEPGTGKSQLARAVAKHQGWKFRACAVDATTETHDLLWRLDSVQRLAEAQLLGSLRAGGAAGAATDADVAKRLELARFIEPGLLWWAFDWHDAERQRAVYERGNPVAVPGDAHERPRCVVLIDEIDKADSAVPNGLLEALGSGQFAVPGVGTIEMDRARPPLVVITTNQERDLPNAFKRRCLVWALKLPDKHDELLAFFYKRGRAHFTEAQCGDEVLREAATIIAGDRGNPKTWTERGLVPPGLAEYIDLVRIVVERDGDDASRSARLKQVAKFVRKHAEPGP